MVPIPAYDTFSINAGPTNEVLGYKFSMLWAFGGEGDQGRLGVRGGLPEELSSLWSEQVEFGGLGDGGKGRAGAS